MIRLMWQSQKMETYIQVLMCTGAVIMLPGHSWLLTTWAVFAN